MRIKCFIHGAFEQVPTNHLQGQGCPKCGRIMLETARRMTLDTFLSRAHAIHGDTYDYSQIVYINCKLKVDIICLQHGVFSQEAASHLTGVGCPKCGRALVKEVCRHTRQEFIEAARQAHGSCYDYSQVNYINSATCLKIVCPKHGAFMQTPSAHIHQKQGCPTCSKIRVADFHRSDLAKFISTAYATHGNKYDYSLVSYINNSTKVEVICSQHGSFWQTPGSHCAGCGCPRCASELVGKNSALTLDEFLARAQTVHGNTYNYSQVVYINNRAKVEIACSTHGIFKQSPVNHLLGNGCPTCGRERTTAAKALDWFEQAQGRLATLYFLRLFDNGEEFYKVGITYHSVAERYRKLHKHGYSYEILAQHTSQNASAVYDWEQSILHTFAHLRYYPKRSFGGETECFSSCEEILQIFPL